MGSNTSTIEINLKTIAGKENKNTIELIHWTPSQRTWRALKTLGLFWMIAVFCILLPVVHFVLVPTFLILAPILAFNTYKQDSSIVAKKLICPECSAELQVSAQKMKWPLLIMCNNCKARVYLHKS